MTCIYNIRCVYIYIYIHTYIHWNQQPVYNILQPVTMPEMSIFNLWDNQWPMRQEYGQLPDWSIWPLKAHPKSAAGYCSLRQGQATHAMLTACGKERQVRHCLAVAEFLAVATKWHQSHQSSIQSPGNPPLFASPLQEHTGRAWPFEKPRIAALVHCGCQNLGFSMGDPGIMKHAHLVVIYIYMCVIIYRICHGWILVQHIYPLVI